LGQRENRPCQHTHRKLLSVIRIAAITSEGLYVRRCILPTLPVAPHLIISVRYIAMYVV
jgi:hypothetical protein